MTEISRAYLKLHDIDRCSRAQAAGLPEQVQAKTMWSGVGFSLGGLNFVVPMNEVSEILQVPKYTQVPGVQSWVKGISNVRGRLMPVLDLMAFLNTPSQLQIKRRRLLAMERGEMYTGLVVDEVLGMQHFPKDSFSAQVPNELVALSQYLKGGFVTEQGYWGWFSLYELSCDPKFLNVAS